MRHCLSKTLAAMGVLLLIGTCQAKEDAEEVPQRASAIAATCSGCHGPASDIITDISLLTDKQLEQALLDFKYGRRSATLMDRLTKGLTDTEITAIAQELGNG